MLTIKQIKREVKYINYIDSIFYEAKHKNTNTIMKYSIYSILISSIISIFIFQKYDLFTVENANYLLLVLALIMAFFLLVTTFCSMVTFKNKNIIEQEKWKYKGFIKLNEKGVKQIQKAETKISKSIKECIKEEILTKDKVYSVYIYLLKKEKMIDILNNLEEMVNDLNKNDRKDLKSLLFEYIINEIDKVDFNNNKNKIIEFIENEFNNKSVIYFLEKIKKLKFKYDDEEVNKYKNQLKNDIITNEVKKEAKNDKKIIQSI